MLHRDCILKTKDEASNCNLKYKKLAKNKRWDEILDMMKTIQKYLNGKMLDADVKRICPDSKKLLTAMIEFLDRERTAIEQRKAESV